MSSGPARRRPSSGPSERHGARRVEAILDVNRRLALGPRLDETLSRITDEAVRLLGADGAGLRLLEGGWLVRAATSGPAAIMVRERLRVGESLSGRVAAEGRPIASADLAADARYDPVHRSRSVAQGLASWLGVPLRGREGVLGVLAVWSRCPGRFTQADVGLLEAFADQAAIAILPNRRLTTADLAGLRQKFEADYAAMFERPIPGAAIEVLSWSVLATTEARNPAAVAAVARKPAGKAAGSRKFFDGRAGEVIEIPLYRREDMAPGATIAGPAVIAEDETSTFVSTSFDAHIDGAGSIVMERKAA